MPAPKHLVLIAGEESGDQHAAALAKALLAWCPTLELTGIGGEHMQQAGVTLISDLARYGVTGLTEVARHALTIRKAFKAMQTHLQTRRPDALILIDYPGFNLRMAKYAKQTLGLKVFYYISPQIWAWKAKRIEAIQRDVDHMAVILPFEKAMYEKANVDVCFTGHPLVEQQPDMDYVHHLRHTLCPNEHTQMVALLPGSRTHEIERHMPVLVETAKQLLKTHPHVQFVLPVAKTLESSQIERFLTSTHLPIHCINGHALEAAKASDCIIVASGTASLECALLGKPMCIIYKASLLTYLIASQVIRVRFLGLCNLLSNAMIVSEFLQYDCNPKELTREVRALLDDSERQTRMVEALTTLKTNLSSSTADCTLLEWVQRGLGC